MKLQGKTAVVTGRGGYSGAEICWKLASEGAQVAVIDIRGEAAEKNVEGALITAHVLYGRKHIPKNCSCASRFFLDHVLRRSRRQTVRYNSFFVNSGQREKHPGDAVF